MLARRSSAARAWCQTSRSPRPPAVARSQRRRHNSCAVLRPASRSTSPCTIRLSCVLYMYSCASCDRAGSSPGVLCLVLLVRSFLCPLVVVVRRGDNSPAVFSVCVFFAMLSISPDVRAGWMPRAGEETSDLVAGCDAAVAARASFGISTPGAQFEFGVGERRPSRSRTPRLTFNAQIPPIHRGRPHPTTPLLHHVFATHVLLPSNFLLRPALTPRVRPPPEPDSHPHHLLHNLGTAARAPPILPPAALIRTCSDGGSKSGEGGGGEEGGEGGDGDAGVGRGGGAERGRSMALLSSSYLNFQPTPNELVRY